MKSLYVIFFLSIFVIGCGQSQFTEANYGLTPSANVDDEELKLIHELIKDFPPNTEIAIGFTQDDVTYYYGVRRQEDDLIYIENQNAVFEAGSISKVFTATLLASMVHDNLLSLDDPINEKLGIRFNDERAISFQQLSNHTSGMPRLPSNLEKYARTSPDNPYKDYDAEALLYYLENDLALNQDPGLKYEYSNLGTGLLGHILSIIADNSYDDLLKERVFAPYAMKHSSTLKNEVADKLVIGLDNSGQPTSNWDLASLKGAGAVLATAEDLMFFAQAHFDSSDDVLTLTREVTFTVNDNLDMALGWHVLKNKSVNPVHWHNGGTGGYRSSLAVDVKAKRAVVVLSNVSAFNRKSGKIDELCFELLNRMEDD